MALLMPARHVLETRSPHFSFMLLKDYWFKELGLKVAASLDRTESFIKTIEGQVRCITAECEQTAFFFLQRLLAFAGRSTRSVACCIEPVN